MIPGCVAETTVTGRAVDVHGRPCADAAVQARWLFPDPRDERSKIQADHTDAKGYFRLSGPGIPTKITVVVTDGVQGYGEIAPHSSRDIVVVVR